MEHPKNWHYRAYDLHIVCDFELPELVPWPGEFGESPDVRIETGETLAMALVERAIAEDDVVQWGAQQSRLLFQLARFTVRDGNHVLVEPLEGYGPSSWRVPLLGSVLAALLEQRGLFALHGGALVFGKSAAVFLGDKGQGKSTLNAALNCAGFPLLNDDVTALQMPDDSLGKPVGRPLAFAGFSQVKLLPDAARAVAGSDSSQWPTLAPEIDDFDKRAFQASLAQNNAPLRAIFVLHSAPEAGNSAPDDAEITDAKNGTDAHSAEANAEAIVEANAAAHIEEHGLRLRRLGAQEALAQLIPHTFGARFGAGYLEGERRKRHFLDCARLVNTCAVWELTRPRDLMLLPATVALIARVMAADAADAV